MGKVFDQIRAHSSVSALGSICRHHPEVALNMTALREEIDAANEQIEQLARALREEVAPPTFMGEPLSVAPMAYASSKPERINQLMSARQYMSCLPKNRVDFDIPLYAHRDPSGCPCFNKMGEQIAPCFKSAADVDKLNEAIERLAEVGEGRLAVAVSKARDARAALEKLLRAEEKYVRDTGLPQPDDLIQEAVNEARVLLGWPLLALPDGTQS